MPQIQLLAPGPDRPGIAALPHALLVLDGFPKALGGGERVALRLAAMLPQYGFRVSLLTLSLHPQSSFKPSDAPCPVYLLPLTNAFGTGALQGALALRRLLLTEKIQIVQTFFESSDLWAGLVTRLLSPAKLVWSRRDMGILRRRKHSFAYRALNRLPHAVMAVSARVAEHVRTTDRVPENRIHVVYNGLDLEPVEAALPSTASPFITTVGNIRRVKGHDVLLRAVPAVLAQLPSAVFTFAGEVLEPDYFRELQQTAQALGVADHVTFLGKITDLKAHLRTANLFVLPSRSEGFSNALVEAMAAGLPVVATDVGGNAEAVENGRSGIIVQPEDVNQLAEAMLHILLDPSLADSFRIAARQAIQERFTTEAMMRRIVEIYRSSLQS